MFRLKEDLEDWAETKWDSLKKARWKIFASFLCFCILALLIFVVISYFIHCNSCELSDYAEYGSFEGAIRGHHNAHRLLIQTIARDPIHYGLHYYDYRAKKSIALIDMGQKETERIKAMTYDHMTACVFILKSGPGVNQIQRRCFKDALLRPRVIYKAENRDTVLSTLKFDWVGRNLVFFKHVFGHLEYELVILSADNPQRMASLGVLVQRPRDLVLDSNAGYIFITDHTPKIQRLKFDSSDHQIIFAKTSFKPNKLEVRPQSSLDEDGEEVEAGRLFVTEANEHMIMSMDYQGNNVTILHKVTGAHIGNIGLDLTSGYFSGEYDRERSANTKSQTLFWSLSQGIKSKNLKQVIPRTIFEPTDGEEVDLFMVMISRQSLQLTTSHLCPSLCPDEICIPQPDGQSPACLEQPFSEDQEAESSSPNLDHSPEIEQQERECESWEFSCGNPLHLENSLVGPHCISEEWVCDGKLDCPNGRDESANCSSSDSQCSAATQMFKCEDGIQCIPKNWVCDGQKECSDGSDEKDCFVKGRRRIMSVEDESLSEN